MTRGPRDFKTLAEHHAHLKETGEYDAMVARRAKRDLKVSALEKAIYASEAPLVAELRSAGFEVDSAWDLFNRKEPWRKDIPIPSYESAVPMLIAHLKRGYPYDVRQGIVRALTAPWGRVAFEALVDEFRRTAGADVAADEQRRSVKLVLAETDGLYDREEAERIMANRWQSYRFVLANAIGEHFGKEHVPLVVELLQDETQGWVDRKTLADAVRKKVRRWRRKDAVVLSLLEGFKEI